MQLTVAPDFVPAPAFIETPVLHLDAAQARVDYLIDLQGRVDASLVTWYRCEDRRGGGAVPVAVSRGGVPKKSYRPTRDDVGHYLAVGVAPAHLRCLPGAELRVVSASPVKAAQAETASVLTTDFSDFPTDNRTAVRPGAWTVDAFKPADTAEYPWSTDLSQPCWEYGSGINGARGLGIQPVQQGARLRYTPLAGKYGDMSVSWQIDPAKDGGQGFASARQQYLDFFIKFDTQTLSGYALRVIRTVKYSDAVDVLLVRYDRGTVTPLTESVTVDCFLTGCTLTLEAAGDRLRARVSGPRHSSASAADPRVKPEAELEAVIAPNPFGGLGLQHTSTVGAESRILVHALHAEWK